MNAERGRHERRDSSSASGSAAPASGTPLPALDPHPESHHVVGVPVYVAIFAALLVLTALTVAVAYVDLGRFNLLVALTIAIAKGTLVVLYFMHARWGGAVTWVFIVAGFFWLAILVVITLGDYTSRAWEYVPQGWA